MASMRLCGHTKGMVSRVVVERRGVDAALRLRPHIGPIAGRAREGELHLGSQDLLRIADYATQNGFSFLSISLSDSSLYPLPQDEQDEISGRLIDIYQKFGLAELMITLEDEFDGIYAVGITVVNNSTGRRIKIRRRGFVETSVVQEAENLLSGALRELKLS